MTKQENDKLTFSGSNYLMEVYALTKSQEQADKPTFQDKESVLPSVATSKIVIFGPIIIFILLFIAAFGIQIVGRILNRKQIISALVIALMFASIPTVLNSLQNGVRFIQYASPDEIPKNVKVKQSGVNSVLISWQTDAEKIGGVRIAPNPYSREKQKFYIADYGKIQKIHQVEIGRLDKGLYMFEIFSGTSWFNIDGNFLQFEIK